MVDNLTRTLEVNESFTPPNTSASYTVRAGDKYAEVLGISAGNVSDVSITYAGVVLAYNENYYNTGASSKRVRVGTFIDLSDGVGKNITVGSTEGGTAYIYIYR